MAQSLKFYLSFLTLLLSLSTLPTPSLSSLYSFVYGGCSQVKYSLDDIAYTTNLNSLLSSLVSSATYSSYNHFAVAGTSPHDVVYGLYQCRGDLPMPACASCVTTAISKLGGLCPLSFGGVVQLQGCLVKFDKNSFIGVEDKTVVTKKCGPPTNGADNGKIVARDAVLDGLLAGSQTMFRVGGAKDVQAIAQCVGDLSTGECQDCIGEGIKQVKMECGTGSSGDMYLAKCYIRYTVGGGRGYFDSYFSNNGSGKNRGVKTFSLVVGLLAAIVILIIFFTFLCRVFGRGHGK